MVTIAETAQRVPASDRDCYPTYGTSVEKYEQLVGFGVFTKHDKMQLINGRLVAKATKIPPHAVANDRCNNALSRSLPTGWSVRTENPIRLPPGSEPEPDQCVVRGELTDYVKQHPSAGDVGLLVEIADVRLDNDRKMALTYSASGIPVYWIVNLVEGHIEVYTSPTPGGYDIKQHYKPDETVPIVLDGIVVSYVAVSDILP